MKLLILAALMLSFFWLVIKTIKRTFNLTFNVLLLIGISIQGFWSSSFQFHFRFRFRFLFGHNILKKTVGDSVWRFDNLCSLIFYAHFKMVDICVFSWKNSKTYLEQPVTFSSSQALVYRLALAIGRNLCLDEYLVERCHDIHVKKDQFGKTNILVVWI